MPGGQQGGGLIARWLARRAGRRDRRATAHRLYVAAVAMARQPLLYAEWGVPDTNDGRLEMIGLHVALVTRRLVAEGGAGRELARALQELMYADIDRSLREMGVGDLSVGKKVKAIAGSLMGRAAALDRALAEGDRGAMTRLLERNLYLSGKAPARERIESLADHLVALDRQLAGTSAADLLRGELPPQAPP